MQSVAEYLNEFDFAAPSSGGILTSDIETMSSEEKHCLLDFVYTIKCESYLHLTTGGGYHFNLYELPDDVYNAIAGYIDHIITFRGKSTEQIIAILAERYRAFVRAPKT